MIVVGAAVFAASSGPLTPVRLTAAACGMGAGIVTMHYLGMTALHTSVAMQHAPSFTAASMAVAIFASGLALWLAGGRGGRPPLLLSATAFGIAISGMHYTAMAGLTLYPHSRPPTTMRCRSAAARDAALAVLAGDLGRGDEAALQAALAAEADYVAFVGSRKKAEALKATLATRGVPPAQLEKLKCPAGLDLGAITPDEIAISILAEIIAARRGRHSRIAAASA